MNSKRSISVLYLIIILIIGCNKEPVPDGSEGTITYEGQAYTYKTFGKQTWMTENLAYLPEVSPPTVSSHSERHYYVYGYEGTSVNAATATLYYATYGVLYNWEAALTACPPGWHLPSDAEWEKLTDYLINNGFGYGGTGGDIGKSMASTTGWARSSVTGEVGNDQTTNNSSGFNVVPAGQQSFLEGFIGLGNYASFWTSNMKGGLSAWARDLYSDNTEGLYADYWSRSYGFSVRCLKN